MKQLCRKVRKTSVRSQSLKKIDDEGRPLECKEGIDQLANVIKLIKEDPTSRRILMTTYNPEQADAFKRECKIGEYREWIWNMVRLKEINDMVIKGEILMHERVKPKTGKIGRIAGGVNIATGKKQQQRMEEQFIHQLNNE